MYKLAFRSINIALLEKYGDNASIQIAQRCYWTSVRIIIRLQAISYSVAIVVDYYI